MAVAGRAIRASYNNTPSSSTPSSSIVASSPMMATKLEPYNAYAALQQHTSATAATAMPVAVNGSAYMRAPMVGNAAVAAAFPLLSLAATALSPSTMVTPKMANKLTAASVIASAPVASSFAVNGSKLRVTPPLNHSAGVAVPSATIAGVVSHGVTPVMATKAVVRSSLSSPSITAANVSMPPSAPLLSLAAHALLPPASATSSAIVAAGAANYTHNTAATATAAVASNPAVIAHPTPAHIAVTPSPTIIPSPTVSTRHGTRAATAAAATSEPKKATANHRLSAPSAVPVAVVTPTPSVSTRGSSKAAAAVPVMVRSVSPIDDDDDRDDSSSPPTVGGSSNNGGSGDKVKKRLARKAELARASRRRKKAYVSDLEAKVTQLSARVAELERELQLRGGIVPPVAGSKPRGRSSSVKATKSTPPPVVVPSASRTSTPARSHIRTTRYEQQQQQDMTNDDGDGASSPSSSIDDSQHSTASLSPPLTPLDHHHHSPMMYPAISSLQVPPSVAAATATPVTATAVTPSSLAHHQAAMDSAMALVLASSNYGYVMPPPSVLPIAPLILQAKEEEKECKSGVASECKLDNGTQWGTLDQKEEEKEVKMPDNEMKRMQRQLLNSNKANGNMYSALYASTNGTGSSNGNSYGSDSQQVLLNGNYHINGNHGKRRYESNVSGASSSLVNYGSVGEAKIEPVIPSSSSSSGKHDDCSSEEKRVNTGTTHDTTIPPLENVSGHNGSGKATSTISSGSASISNDVERMTKRARVDDTIPTPTNGDNQ